MFAFTQHRGMIPLRGAVDVPQCLARVAAALKSNGARIVHSDDETIRFEGGALWYDWTIKMTKGTVRVDFVGREHVFGYDVSLRGIFHKAIRVCAYVTAFGVLFATCGGWFLAAVMLVMSAGMSVLFVLGVMLWAKNRVDAFFYNALRGHAN